jgi:biopolymer transport protein ExbB
MLGFIEQGGLVMWPLLASALLLWFGLGYRAVAVRRGTKLGVRSLMLHYHEHPDDQPRGFLDSAAKAALEVRREHGSEIRRFLDDELFSLEDGVGRFRVLVRTIVVIAPLLGLLGTVNGMIEMFESLGNQTFFSQSGGVANGISQALFTTQFGLVIAIPGMIVGGLIDRKERKIKDDIRQVKDLVVSEPTNGDTEQSA